MIERYNFLINTTAFKQTIVSALLLMSAPTIAADCDGDVLVEGFSALGFKKLAVVSKMWAHRSVEEEKAYGFRHYDLDNQDYLLDKIPDIGEIDDKTRYELFAQSMKNVISVSINEFDNAELARIAATTTLADYSDNLKPAGNYVIYTSNANHSIYIEPIRELLLACNKPLHNIFRSNDVLGFDLPDGWQEYKLNQPEISDTIAERNRNAP